MGNNYEGQDSGIDIVMKMPELGRKYINHHLGNALGCAILCLDVDDINGAKESLNHAIKDLRVAGLLSLRRPGSPENDEKKGKNSYV